MHVNTFLSNVWPIALTCVLGLVAVYTLLPQPRRLPVLLGTVCGVLALVLAGWLVTRASSFSIETFLFYVFAASAIGFGALLVTQSNPARAALSFALVILSTCGLFLLQAAPFLMAATIIVYAGAIVVTFLFVIMLAQQEGPSDADARSREPFLSAFTGFLLLGTLLYVLKLNYKPDIDRWVGRTRDQVAKIEDLRQRAESKSNAPTPEDVKRLMQELEQFRIDYECWWRGESPEGKSEDKNPPSQPYPPGGEQLKSALVDAKPDYKDDKSVADNLAALEEQFRRVEKAGEAARNNPLLGNRQPRPRPATAFSALSEMSGPRPNLPLEQLRRDGWGRPKMPAENAEYLGRSLFSDYLLAVELAGMLLLVATIGAIAIAHRRSGPTAPALTRERM